MKKKNYIQKKYLKKNLLKKLRLSYRSIQKNISENLNKEGNIYNLLTEDYNLNFKPKDLKRFKKFKTLAIIGMGGSILGAEAIFEFLKKKIKTQVYFFNDINEEKIMRFKKKENLDRTLFLVISKSGNTLETLSNFLSLNIIKPRKKNIIIISEKSDNELFNLSRKLNLFFIEHKKFIGGRYSVLSEVGMVPAYLMGLNIYKIKKNLKKNLTTREQLFLKESSIKISNLLISKRLKNIILLNYNPKLEKFLFWFQQLLAESLGKKGKGFLPVISNAPKDHHSLLQLYLDGPNDKIFYVFSNDAESKIKLSSKKYLKTHNYLHKKSIGKVKISQKNAVIKSFLSKKIPFREFTIQKHSEEVIGELFSYFILEVITVGKLTGINPFNQPAVEQVKNLTKRLLN